MCDVVVLNDCGLSRLYAHVKRGKSLGGAETRGS